MSTSFLQQTINMYFLGNVFIKKLGLSKFHQGFGGICFINAHQCIEKLYIEQTSLLLNQNVNIDGFDV